jgi:hypothetical protein
MIKSTRSTAAQRSSNKSNRPLGRESKIKDLLSDEETIDTTKSAQEQLNSSEKLDFSKFIITANRYDYPRLGKVPAITYYSTIADMKIREKDGKTILDVYYDLQDSWGRTFYIIQSYPEGSQPFRRLGAALAAAGVPNGATADAGIGVVEIITLDYPSNSSELGSIVERKPYVPSSVDAEEDLAEGDDFDDFLPDEEE